MENELQNIKTMENFKDFITNIANETLPANKFKINRVDKNAKQLES